MIRALRILHFSDIHIGMHIRHMHWKKWFSKRAVGAINLFRGRGKYFDEAEQKMQALARFKEQNDIDLVINTGDYTALGLERELQLAKKVIEPMMNAPDGYLTVPGNHDIYVSEVKSQQRFSELFSEVLQSDIPEYCSDGHWPLVRLIRDDSAVIAINSARPNPLPWRSNGNIPQSQLDAFASILRDQRLKKRFIFVVTHYAPRLANGADDTRLHGMVNADDFLGVCQKIDYGAILCGHVHQTYHVNVNELRSDIYCAGSAVMSGHEGFWVYERQGNSIEAFRGYWDGARCEYSIRRN
ncbi:MAG: metallophosphoesterase [Pseudomonadota bacterium]